MKISIKQITYFSCLTVSFIASPLSASIEGDAVSDVTETQKQPVADMPLVSSWERSSELFEDSGITTTYDDRRGNWYSKKQLLADARRVYDEIRKKVSAIESQENEIDSTRRTDLAQQITNFVKEFSFKEGVIEQLLTGLKLELEKERRRDGQLSEQERAYLQEVQSKLKELEALKNDIQRYYESTLNLDKAYITLNEQISRAQEYEQRAWENYDKISEVLNDEIAEQLYLAIQGFMTNISLIDQYIKNDFMRYLDQTENIITQLHERIKKRVEDLQSRGLELLEKIDVAIQEDQIVTTTKVEPVKQLGWTAQIGAFFTGIFGWISDLLSSFGSWIKSWFISEKPVMTEPVQERATAPSTAPLVQEVQETVSLPESVQEVVVEPIHPDQLDIVSEQVPTFTQPVVTEVSEEIIESMQPLESTITLKPESVITPTEVVLANDQRVTET